MSYPYDAPHQPTPGQLPVPATHNRAVEPLGDAADAALETRLSYAAGDQQGPIFVAPPLLPSDNFYG